MEVGSADRAGRHFDDVTVVLDPWGGNGLHIKLTIHLPLAAPDELIIGHLHHFSLEFRNWTRMAMHDTSDR